MAQPALSTLIFASAACTIRWSGSAHIKGSMALWYCRLSSAIRPSKDIRTNYAQISALTRDNPVAITVNGKEDTVLLSHEDYQQTMHYISELEEKLALYAHLAQSMDDIRLGRVHSADDVFNDLLNDLENLDV